MHKNLSRIIGAGFYLSKMRHRRRQAGSLPQRGRAREGGNGLQAGMNGWAYVWGVPVSPDTYFRPSLSSPSLPRYKPVFETL